MKWFKLSKTSTSGITSTRKTSYSPRSNDSKSEIQRNIHFEQLLFILFYVIRILLFLYCLLMSSCSVIQMEFLCISGYILVISFNITFKMLVHPG